MRQKETYEIVNAIRNKEPLIIITGRTGTGKSTLLRIILNDYSKYNIDINFENYLAEKNLRRSYIVDEIEKSLQKMIQQQKDKSLRQYLARLNGITFDDQKIILDKQLKKLNIIDLFLAVNKWADDKKLQLVLAIDGADMLNKFQHFDFQKILAYIYDNCKNITTILVGQSERILESLGFHDTKAPLYGRALHSIHLSELTKEESGNFLIKGLTKNRKKISKKELKIISEIIERIPGILSSLALTLNLLSIKIDEKSLSEAIKKSSQMVRKDFENFLANRSAKEKYEKIMLALSKKPLPWKKIKEYLELEFGENLYDKNFNDLLDSLETDGFIRKEGEKYSISNPLLAYSFSGRFID